MALSRFQYHPGDFFRILFLFLVTNLFSIQVFSQTIEIQARVIDSSSLEPVAFSTVYVNENTGTISDDLGFFRLQIPQEYIGDTLHVSCVGYHGKSIPVAGIDRFGLDTIYLQPGIIELSEVQVQTKSKKPPKSQQIIRLAIRKILHNYPDFSVLYNGYYREYVKEGDDYINLFESIMNIEDPGFGSVDNFEAGLLFKRINTDFRVDEHLMRPYDNQDKFVPYSFMPIPINNELLILRAHDPVRNYNRHSLYFFEQMEKDFIRNHDFSTPKLTYLEDRPYYLISFKDNRKYYIRNNHISTSGLIYIDAINYGIKRIKYESTIDDGINRRKLFGLNLEYNLEKSVYLLHYLSFNNLFFTRNFALINTRIWEDMVQLSFNRPVNYHYASNPDNIAVYLEGARQEIENIDIQRSFIYLSFDKNSTLGEKLKINLLPRNVTTRKKIARNIEYLNENLEIEFLNFRDLDENEIADNEFNEYYQYREFFTNRTWYEHDGITSNLIIKSIPVIDNRIFGEYSGDTSWLNTPLIEEDVATRIRYSNNPKLNRFIDRLNSRDENNLTESVYIQTDREVYAPEDTIWFRAFIRNKKYLTESDLSRVFHVLLVDEAGEIISRDKYLITESAAHGQIRLEHTLEEGIYFLAGYSSWMENFGTDALFHKRIMVQKEKREGLMLAAAFERSEYFPGDTARMLVSCYDDFNREVDDVSFTYRLVDGNKVLQRGRGTTSKSWLEPVPLILPDNLVTPPRVEFSSSYKLERLDTVYSVPVNNFIHIDFFPEGGRCINGIKTNIAFKAVNDRGDPVEVKGEIIDQDGRVLASAETQHDGMGVFEFRPEHHGTCYFRITGSAVLNNTFLLPQGTDKGWQLELKRNKQNKDIELEITNADTGNDTALVTLMVRGYLCYSTVIETRNKKTVKIYTDNLPPGIGVVTLFDNRLIPRAERLVYIHPSQTYRAEIQTDRQRYVPRDSVTLTVRLDSDLPSTVRGSFSLAVIDNQLCTSETLDEPGIKSTFLLSPEIRGEVSRPEYYLNEANKDALEHLDLLLMTQGWRNYIVPDTGSTNNMTTRPVNMDIISGRLSKPSITSGWKPTDGRLVVNYGGKSTSIPVEKDGAFSFLPDYSPEFNSGLFLYAEDKREKSNLSILLNSSVFEKDLEGYLQFLTDSMGRKPVKYAFNLEQLQDHFSYRLENHYWLEEVVIRKTVSKKEFSTADLAMNKRKARPDQLEMAGNMQDLELIIRRPNPYDHPVYYCIDGILQFTYVTPDLMAPPVMVPDYTHAYYIRPQDVEEYTVISGEEVQALYGYGIMYVIDVKTKPFSERESSNKWENPVTIDKFAVAKEFYRPRYDTEEKRSSTIPDLRKTIHWEPDLKIGEDGIATVKFYNGDRYTRIKCILEGITEEGIPVEAEYYYDVSLTRE